MVLSRYICSATVWCIRGSLQQRRGRLSLSRTPLTLLLTPRIPLTPRSGKLAMPSAGRNHFLNEPREKSSYPGDYNDTLLDDHALVRTTPAVTQTLLAHPFAASSVAGPKLDPARPHRS